MIEIQPIETAPKDRPITAFCPEFGWDRMSWTQYTFREDAKPFWMSLTRGRPLVEAHRDQPTHWVDLPPP